MHNVCYNMNSELIRTINLTGFGMSALALINPKPIYRYGIDPMKEEMKTIPSAPMYKITESGDIYSLYYNPPRLLKRRIDTKGYYAISLVINSNACTRFLSRLLLETFVGPCPDGMQCRHLDGNSKNNDLSNLAWGTPFQNSQDKREHGTFGRKLDDEKVKEILIHIQNHNMADTANKFKVSSATVSNICHGRSWQHLTKGSEYIKKYAKLDKFKVLEIRRKHADGTGAYELAKEYKVNPHAIYHVIKRKTWKHVPEQQMTTTIGAGK